MSADMKTPSDEIRVVEITPGLLDQAVDMWGEAFGTEGLPGIISTPAGLRPCAA